MSPFVSCPSCSCAVKHLELECPHCGAGLRSSRGTITKTAAFVMLGLAGLPGCPEVVPVYGVPATGGAGGGEEGGAKNEGGAGGGDAGGVSDGGFAADYGVAATGGGGAGGN
jgi:hypothetical protein